MNGQETIIVSCDLNALINCEGILFSESQIDATYFNLTNDIGNLFTVSINFDSMAQIGF